MGLRCLITILMNLLIVPLVFKQIVSTWVFGFIRGVLFETLE